MLCRRTLILQYGNVLVVTLTVREKAAVLISNGISVYSLLQERGELPKNVTIYDFVLKSIPDDVRPEVTALLIDEIFEYVSHTHNS